jgi:hypothetical protein
MTMIQKPEGAPSAEDTSEQDFEAMVEESINHYVAKQAWRVIAFLFANGVCLLVGLGAIFSWKKDTDFARESLNAKLSGLEAKFVVVETQQKQIQELQTWKAEITQMSLQSQAQITALQQSDLSQRTVLESLLQGQAEIKAELRRIK